jgi:EpsD family peptidyl-prolyl cis-trans isomerase
MIRSHTLSPSSLAGPGRTAAMAAVVLAALLAGCGDKKDKPATQTAARVNKEEITVHQINYVLSQQRTLAPEQAASAGRVVLERLIDQELALQQASEKKVDRDPRVAQQIEAARREIVARAYMDKIGSGAPRPSPEEIKKYYDEHPALFKQRRIYTMQEINVEAKPEQAEQLRVALTGSKDLSAFANYLKTNDFRYVGNQGVRTAEQIPLAMLPTLAQLKDGQTLFNRTPTGVQVVVLVSSRSQPVDEERARPAIEQFLLNERKRKVIEDDLKALRSSAKIEYVGAYVKGAPDKAASAPLEVKPSVSPLTATPASAPEPLIPVQPASVPSGSALDKGLMGLK